MRLFTEEEKELLRRINDKQGFNLYSLINPWIKGVSFEISSSKNDVTFIFENTQFNIQNLSLADRLHKIQSIVIQAVNIIKLFEDKGYIFTFQNTHQIPDPYIFGQASINLPSITYRFPDTRISKLFTEYATNEIFVTPELKRFINDGFITRDVFRVNRQFKTTLSAVIIAFLGLLINFAFNIFNLNKSNSEIKPLDTATMEYGMECNYTDSTKENRCISNKSDTTSIYQKENEQ